MIWHNEAIGVQHAFSPLADVVSFGFLFPLQPETNGHKKSNPKCFPSWKQINLPRFACWHWWAMFFSGWVSLHRQMPKFAWDAVKWQWFSSVVGFFFKLLNLFLLLNFSWKKWLNYLSKLPETSLYEQKSITYHIAWQYSLTSDATERCDTFCHVRCACLIEWFFSPRVVR